MSRFFVPAIVAGVVAAGVSYGVARWTKPPQQLVSVNAPTIGWGSLDANPAKARRIAQTTWPEMEQAEVDALTAVAREVGGSVVIFCHDEAKCGDLALNLDNAFESAHWASRVKIFANVPPGVEASTPALAAMLNAATGGRFDVGVDLEHNATGDYVTIGPRKEPAK